MARIKIINVFTNAFMPTVDCNSIELRCNTRQSIFSFPQGPMSSNTIGKIACAIYKVAISKLQNILVDRNNIVPID